MTLPTRTQRRATVADLEAALADADPLTRIRLQRQLDAERAALRAVDQLVSPGHRSPYVGDGVDGALRSAQIDREEADCLDRTDARYERLLDSAAAWERQAAELADAGDCVKCFRPRTEHASDHGVLVCPTPL